MFGGPTELDRGEDDADYDPNRELINRVKFGTEGALFTGLIGGVGSVLKSLSKRKKQVLEIYKSFNKKNQHKMNPIPICIIPKKYKI